jgi:hypothetical protein
MSATNQAAPQHDNDALKVGNGDIGSLTPGIPDEGLKLNRVEADIRLAGTDGVPVSEDPEVIQKGLEQNPELEKLAQFQTSLTALVEKMRLHEEAGKQIDPAKEDEVMLHQAQGAEYQREALELSEKIGKFAGANKELQTQKQQQPQYGNNNMHLGLPLLGKLWDKTVDLLKLLFDMLAKMFKAAASVFGVGGPKADSSNTAPTQPRKATSFSLGSIGGVAGAVPTKATPAAIEQSFDSAIQASQQRIDQLKEQQAKLDAKKALEADLEGQAPGGSAGQKP